MTRASLHDALNHDRPNRHLSQDDLGNSRRAATGHSLKFMRCKRVALLVWEVPGADHCGAISASPQGIRAKAGAVVSRSLAGQ
ncbi:hypothetical protein SBA1_10043 [Candidatus Sulfotelmatobacter kueseliae]|uniref:Uncharacterized protein n=1 Tax=Candidatus Sulfotelmatobacter kueseliae TaxID=2042962 RepID=A0A2U3JVC8_9BACT|nr:hypothetical protein SBA1_10043 [Candidatus Sulfotelmatobacter kueseliae]